MKVKSKSGFELPVLIQRVVSYPCGCRAEFSIIGVFSGFKQWNPIPCYSHNTEELVERANTDWNLHHNGKL